MTNGTLNLTLTNSSTPTTKRPEPVGRNVPVPTTKPTNVQAPVVVRPNENPAHAVQRMSNSMMAVNLQSSIAPPAVRPCFVRPAFCPATADACATSRCARLYTNGVRIGNRYYRKVKCRLNYCRETCGKAEWFADGRRLVGCSDSISTIDEPIWSVQRVYPQRARLDSRVLPVERVANLPTRTNNLQRRSVHEYIGDTVDAMQEKAKSLGETLNEKAGELKNTLNEQAKTLGDKIKHTFTNLNKNTEVREGEAVKAATMKNITDLVDEQLTKATEAIERDREQVKIQNSEAVKDGSTASITKAVAWTVLFSITIAQIL